jgi:aspartate 1-decarboxylase
MKRTLLKSKIHRATITRVELLYEGSLSIDETLLKEADILPFELVQVANVSNGSRFETYAIPAEKDSGEICLNGAAARLGMPGDEIIIMTYGIFENDELNHFSPVVVKVNKENKISVK